MGVEAHDAQHPARHRPESESGCTSGPRWGERSSTASGALGDPLESGLHPADEVGMAVRDAE